ncbi:MAG TPA: hypothetical protein PLO63_10745 [Syntrophales bacterium]|nr:hypothetical protein [Syntrophales bacterium]
MLSLVILATMLALFTVLLVRRGRDATAGETLANYLNALISGRTEEAYQLLSAADRTRESQAEYRARRSLGSGLVAGLIAPSVSFTIETAETENGRATAVASVTAPDYAGLLHEAMLDAETDGLPGDNLEAHIFVCRKISHYLDKYRRETVPTRTGTTSFHLVLEKGGWKVCLEEP